MVSFRVHASRATLVLAVVSLLLATNVLWFFPQEGATQLTYERAELTVENGTLTYYGDHRHPETHEYHYKNDLVPVACQYADPTERACALDDYAAEHGPVTVYDDSYTADSTAYSRIDGAYYERVFRTNESTRTYDIEQVTPMQLLAAVARDAADIRPDDLSDSTPRPFHIAVTGAAVTTTEELAHDDLGRVYARNDTYYTVVLTDTATLDRPVVPEANNRSMFTLAGLVLSVVVVVQLLSENP